MREKKRKRNRPRWGSETYSKRVRGNRKKRDEKWEGQEGIGRVIWQLCGRSTNWQMLWWKRPLWAQPAHPAAGSSVEGKFWVLNKERASSFLTRASLFIPRETVWLDCVFQKKGRLLRECSCGFSQIFSTNLADLFLGFNCAIMALKGSTRGEGRGFAYIRKQMWLQLYLEKNHV